MKNILFATTATTALLVGGIASAQGISLFGSARLGLGYNINSDGSVQRNLDPQSSDFGKGTDDINAISRVRFGVNMTGETDSGITFGASIRADNAIGGNGANTIDDGRLTGMTDGDVFVSGGFGTLTYGDTAGADEYWVGDLVGDYSLTGLGDNDETIFFSDGNGFTNSDSSDFIPNPIARPTVRYDFSIAGFGLSLSSNKALTDVGVGAGYSGTFGGNGTFKIGVGYYDYAEFDTHLSNILARSTIPAGHEISASLGGTLGDFGGNIIWTKNDSENADFATLGAGLTAGFGNFDLGAWYRYFNDASGAVSGIDGSNAYGLTGQYDLGGGASVMGGVARTYDLSDQFVNGGTTQLPGAETVADFGISLTF